MHELNSELLKIRPSRPADVTHECISAHNSLECTKYTELRHRVWTREALEQIFSHFVSQESELYTIELIEGALAIGNIRLFNFDLRHRRVEVGIFIWNNASWGRGLGTEALLLIEQYCFEQCKLHRIGADYYATNQASRRMFEKASYTQEGALKDFYSSEGGYVDAIRVSKIAHSVGVG